MVSIKARIMSKSIARAVSNDTRVLILFLLSRREHTITFLAKQLGRSKSTVVEHVNKLEEQHLVRRCSENRKWIPIEITQLGRQILGCLDLKDYGCMYHLTKKKQGRPFQESNIEGEGALGKCPVRI